MVKVREKNGYLYLDIIQNRVHHWESLHIKVSKNELQKKEQLRIAETCRAKRELQILSGEWGFQDSQGAKQSVLNYAQSKVLTKKSSLYRAINYLKKFRDCNVQLQSITPEWVSDFQKFLEAHEYLSQTSKAIYSREIRHLLELAVKERLILRNPAKIVKSISQEETDMPTLSMEELKDFACADISSYGASCRQTQKAFVFACLCGLRISDIYSLKWEHIQNRTLNKYNASPYWITKKQCKTKKVVDIPISQNAWSCIEPLGMPDNFVFPEIAKLKKKDQINIYVHRIAQIAGIKKHVSFHTARRTFATLSLENGVDPFTVQKLMGHSKINMTAVYAKSDRIKSTAIDALDKAIDSDSELKMTIKA